MTLQEAAAARTAAAHAIYQDACSRRCQDLSATGSPGMGGHYQLGSEKEVEETYAAYTAANAAWQAARSRWMAIRDAAN